MQPKVSVIIPVYNTEKTLTKCVDSVINQTLQDVEIILVDDGTPDGAGVLCDAYAQKDPRIKVIHKENGGLSSARNAGMEIATGEYIGFVDSDDYIHPQMYEKLYERILADNSDICLCGLFRVNEQGTERPVELEGLPEKLTGREEIVKYLSLPLIGVVPGCGEPMVEGFVCRNLYRRALIKEQPFLSEREYFAEDVVFNLTVYGRCDSISILNGCFYYYWYNEFSLSNKYRPNLCVLLNNLLDWEASYLEKIEIYGQEQRLYASGVKFVLFCMQNILKAKLGVRKTLQAIWQVLQQKWLKKSLGKGNYSAYSLKYRAVCFCLRIMSLFA